MGGYSARVVCISYLVNQICIDFYQSTILVYNFANLFRGNICTTRDTIKPLTSIANPSTIILLSTTMRELQLHRTPLSPLGIKVHAHNNIETRASWSAHGKLGRYVGPTTSHYRCYRVCLPTTKKIIITDFMECAEDN